MAQPIIQTSLAAGELSPTMYARVDFAKYHIGLATCRNFFVDYRGGVSNRAGTKWIGRAKSTGNVRLIPFQFSTLQAYALEFGDQYIRVIKDGGYVLETGMTITGITQANPAVVTSVAHGFANGDYVFITGVVGMTQVNNRFFIVAGVTANTFQLTDIFGANVNSTGYTAYVSGGVAARVYTVTTPYLSADIFRLKYTQSADVMTITHPGYAPRNLTRSGHAAWTLTSITFGSPIAAPGGFTATIQPTTAGFTSYGYVVTAVDANGQESLGSTPATLTLAIAPGATVFVALAWSTVTGAVYYNIYKTQPIVGSGGGSLAGPTPPTSTSIYGWIGSTEALTFIDQNLISDYTITPPVVSNPFASSNHPATVTYFQQRQVYGGSTLNPQTVWGSRTGGYTAVNTNMNVSNPVREDDAFTATLVGSQVNDIRCMVAMPSGLVIGTGFNAWQLSGGGQNQPLTPINIFAQPQSYNGFSYIAPLVINYDIVYVQDKGSTVRSLAYNFYYNAYEAKDVSLLSQHLLFGFEVVDWTWAEEPFKVAWMVRDDGWLLSMTYLKEQELIGWGRHDTDGSFKSICSISEGEEAAIYVVVERTIGATTLKYIERMFSRNFGLISGNTHVDNGRFLDSALEYFGTVITNVTGLEHLNGKTVTALGDGVVYPGLVVANGSVTLPVASGNLVVGLPYVSQFETLYLDIEKENIQGKRKKISSIVPRVSQTRSIKIGSNFSSLVPSKCSTTPVTLAANLIPSQPGIWSSGLFTGDDRTIADPYWTTFGKICIQQDYPYPVTVLGVIMDLNVGDTAEK